MDTDQYRSIEDLIKHTQCLSVVISAHWLQLKAFSFNCIGKLCLGFWFKGSFYNQLNIICIVAWNVLNLEATQACVTEYVCSTWNVGHALSTFVLAVLLACPGWVSSLLFINQWHIPLNCPESLGQTSIAPHLM